MDILTKQMQENYDPAKPFCWHKRSSIPQRKSIECDLKSPSENTIRYELGNLLDDNQCNFTLYARLPELELVKMPILATWITSPVVNQEVVDVFLKICPKDIQAIPIEIKNHPEIKNLEAYSNKSYYLLNILNLLETIDTDNTVFKYFTEDGDRMKIRGIKQLRLKSNCLNDHNIVRDKNYPRLIVISKELKKLLEETVSSKEIEFIPDFEAY